MRYLFTVALLVFGMAGMGGRALGQGTFALEFREATPQQVPALQETSHWCSRVAARPAAVTRLPEGLPQQVAYFQFGPANAPTWILAVGGEKPLLYADLDRSGDLAKQAPVAGKADQSGTWFEPLTLTAEDGQPVRVRLMSHSGPNQQVLGCLHAFALGCRMGKVRLGDKTYGIALIDGNLNGRYNDRLAASRLRQDTDAVAIDFNGNGVFEPFNPDQPSPEWMPLARGLAADGAFYTVTVAADGSQIEIAPTQPSYGQLDLGPREVRLTAFSDFGLQRIETKGGKVRAVAGRYSTVSGEVRQSDGKAAWRLQLASDPGEIGTFVLHGGETLALPLGEPLVPTVDVALANGTAQLNYRLVGRSGEQYAPAVQKDKVQIPPPRLEVVDASGKVIYSASFEYG